MSTVVEAAEALAAALRGVEGVRYVPDLAAVVEPPATALGPPALTWDAYCVEPTEARFIAYVVVARDERALPRLWDLVPRVAAALDAVPDAVVRRADPGLYPSGELPCYQIQVEVSL
ncbi:hypothetical protein AB0N38_10525 [Micromonospora aurantiaca]|uniref:hypothetical protein n=1 Tax=Micromonospora aurantiaca (nom. illeg.) TaxID=47850 RepID=UPI003449EDD7